MGYGYFVGEVIAVDKYIKNQEYKCPYTCLQLH